MTRSRNEILAEFQELTALPWNPHTYEQVYQKCVDLYWEWHGSQPEESFYCIKGTCAVTACCENTG